MFRLVEASRAIREAVPPELVAVFWLITALGSSKVLIVGLSMAYWNWADRREEILAIISIGFVALTLTVALKFGFDLPRPPAEVQRYPIEPSPVGFPSGHAIAATVIYGGALVVLDRHRERRAVLGVGTLVFAIGLSRVVLGVHYLGDVLAGFAVGLVVLAALIATDEYDAVHGFAVAAVLSVPAVLVTGGNANAALALGGSLGGLAAVLWLSEVISFRSRAEQAALNVGGLAFVGTLVLAGDVVEGLLPVAASMYFLLAFGIVALPMAVNRIEFFDLTSASDR